MVYDGVLIDLRLYDQSVISVIEANGEDIHAVWKNLDKFGAGKSILYPVGLLEMLRK